MSMISRQSVSLTEDGRSSPSGDEPRLGFELELNRNHRVLQSETDSDTQKYLETVEVGYWRSVLDGVEETTRKAKEAWSSDDDPFESTQERDHSRRSHKDENLDEDEREESDTSGRGG